MLSDAIVITEEIAGHSLVHDGYSLRRLDVPPLEVSACEDGNTERLEISRGNRDEKRGRSLARSQPVAVGSHVDSKLCSADGRKLGEGR